MLGSTRSLSFSYRRAISREFVDLVRQLSEVSLNGPFSSSIQDVSQDFHACWIFSAWQSPGSHPGEQSDLVEAIYLLLDDRRDRRGSQRRFARQN